MGLTQEEYDSYYAMHEMFHVTKPPLFDWSNTTVNAVNTVKYQSISNLPGDKFNVKYVPGHRKLKEREIVVNKWVYYTLYVQTHEISLNLDQVRNILDSEDVYAKHVILRNANYAYSDMGMACAYYNIIPTEPTEVISISLYEKTHDNYKRQDFKVVGYYEYTSSNKNGSLLENGIKDIDKGIAEMLAKRGKTGAIELENPYDTDTTIMLQNLWRSEMNVIYAK